MRRCRGTTYPDLSTEFDYIRCWSLGNLEKYADAEHLIRQVIADAPKDPRFHMLRALNLFGWTTNKQECPYGLQDVIDSTLEAVALYEQEVPRDEKRLGLAHNNAAYLYSCDASDSCFSLEKARFHLSLLKAHIDRAQWDPGHPEFFHTEANLLYREYVGMKDNDPDPAAMTSVLRAARESISAAIKIVNKPIYGDLLRKIKAEKQSKDTRPVPTGVSTAKSAPVE